MFILVQAYNMYIVHVHVHCTRICSTNYHVQLVKVKYSLLLQYGILHTLLQFLHFLPTTTIHDLYLKVLLV